MDKDKDMDKDMDKDKKRTIHNKEKDVNMVLGCMNSNPAGCRLSGGVERGKMGLCVQFILKPCDIRRIRRSIPTSEADIDLSISC